MNCPFEGSFVAESAHVLWSIMCKSWSHAIPQRYYTVSTTLGFWLYVQSHVLLMLFHQHFSHFGPGIFQLYPMDLIYWKLPYGHIKVFLHHNNSLLLSISGLFSFEGYKKHHFSGPWPGWYTRNLRHFSMTYTFIHNIGYLLALSFFWVGNS